MEAVNLAAEIERRTQRRLSQQSLIEFTEHTFTRYKTAAHHRIVAEQLERVERREIDRLMLLLPPRHGKACAHDTLVPTPRGWTTHGSLQPGDEVFGPDGQPATVLALSAEVDTVVPVTLSNGEVIRCHPNHEWTVLDRRRHAWRTLETKELEEAGLWVERQGARGSRCRFQLPLTAHVEYPAAMQPVHAYALGAWLGDGSAGSTRIAHSPADREVPAAIVACGYPMSGSFVQEATNVAYSIFAGPRPGVGSELQKGLKVLGILRDKHIPETYLRASLDQP